MRNALPIYLMLFGAVSVFAFFYGSNQLTKQWANYSNRLFEKKLLSLALILRICYVIFIYFFNQYLYGHPYESEIGDIGFYIPTAEQGVDLILHNENLLKSWNDWGIQFSDMGYMLYLSLLYLVTGSISTVLLPLLLKSVFGAYTCLFLYRFAARHFGEAVGRMAGIFCILQFNLIWWCGSMMKETEMIFLLVLFLERIDYLLHQSHLPTGKMILVVVLGVSLFFFRTVLGVVAFAAVLGNVFFSSHKLMNWSKKVLAGVLVLTVLGFALGDSLYSEVQDLTNTADNQQYQETNMNWRAEREGGNQFAKYAGAVVFAPLIFTIPFPSMVYSQPDQEMLMMVNGGNYVKNVMSFFVILAMFSLLFSGQWKKHILPIAFTSGYLVALVISVFAQSGRFHMPILPFEMMFAAYGISLMNNKKKRWFLYALVFEFLAVVGWSWFKLAGRGLI